MRGTDSDVKMWVILSDIASDPSVSEHTLFRSIIDFRRYCARRLRRLRKKLGLSKAKGRNSLSEELLPTAEHVIIPFMLAERAWARAMELKGNALEGPYKNSRTGVGHRRSRQWLTKAASYGTVTRALCTNLGDKTLVQECAAYTCWLEGLDLEMKGEYGRAAVALERSCVVYKCLAERAKPGLEHDAFRQRAINCQMGIQRCAFAGDGGCSIRADHHHHLAVSTINNETGESTAAILNWCGQSLRVTEKVQQRLLTCGMEQQPDAKGVIRTSSGGETGLCYEISGAPANTGVALNETQYARKLQQLEDLSRSVCDVELVSPAVPKGDRIVENNKPLELMTARISYEKLDLLYQRCDSAVADRASAWRRNALEAAESLVLGGISDSKLARMPDDVLYLYENLIQVTTGMSSLAGVRDGHDEVLAEVLDARAAALRAYKCHYLAETFSVRASLAPNAFALFHHASHLADCALLEAEACEVPQMGQEMAHLSDASRASTSRLKAARVMKSNHNGDCQIRGGSFSTTSTLLGHLEIHPGYDDVKSSLATIMVRPRAVLCKPLLFNIAHNKLDLPSFQLRASKISSQGLFGWFRR